MGPDQRQRHDTFYSGMVKREKLLLWIAAGTAMLYLLARSNKGSTLVTDILTSGSRGIRNNNPGNIRKSATVWTGQAATQTDPDFVQFIAPEYGIRAMAKIFKSYLARGADTIEKMASTYAPRSENDTVAYIESVSRETGIPSASRVSASDFAKLIPAFIRHENGAQPYSIDIINKGISLS
jgi:hypothetical protein